MMTRRTLVAAMVLAAGCFDGIEGSDVDELKLDETDLIVQNLELAGFPEEEIGILPDGTVYVGSDAIVTLQASRELAGITTDGPEGDDFRQYRTTNTVDTTTVQTICINPTATFNSNAGMSAALDQAIAAYNAQGLQFTMVRSGSGCDANIAANLDNSGGGVSGFPSGGLPYYEFFVGQNLASNYGVSVAAHVIEHELGHSIGFRHTDYFNRSISCGGGATNEGDGGVGAIHIPGTPTGAVLNGSVMNSCFNSGSTGIWTPDDVTALDCLYDSGSCAPPPPPSYDTTIDTQANQSASTGAFTQYGPYDASTYEAIRFSISGGSGDADLYVRFGAAPTLNTYDCRPWLTGNSESCEFNPAQSGDYYVAIDAYSNYSGVTLTVEGAGGGPPPDPEVCDNGVDDDGDGSTDCADSDCTGDPACAPGGWSQLWSSGFESGWGNFNDGGSDAGRTTSYPNTGSYSAYIRDNSGASSSIYSNSFSVSGYSQVQIDFSFYAVSMESGEDFFVELWDGSSWQVVASYARGSDFDNTTRYDESIVANVSGSSTQLRFRCDASGNNDLVYIDDVVVSAQ